MCFLLRGIDKQNSGWVWGESFTEINPSAICKSKHKSKLSFRL